MREHTPAICALVSGGLDSAALLWNLTSRRQVVPLYVRCGLRWERAELHWLRRFLRRMRSPRLDGLRILELPLRTLYRGHWSLTGRGVPGAAAPDRAVYLPGRNVLLLGAAGVACAQQGLSTIVLGTLKGNPFGDATPAFFRAMGACLTQALAHPIRIMAPLAGLRKAQVVRAARAAPVHLTFSCLRPVGFRHCGRCNKCAERRRAFRQAGLVDPTRYG